MSIEVKHLTHIYNPDTNMAKKALDDISVQFHDGEFIGLIGHTGSGKSTFIQHLNALLKPTSGEILLNGKNIFDPNTHLKEIRQRVGLVFQYPEHQLFEMTVYRDVAYGPTNLGLTIEEIDSRVREALAVVGLGEDMYEKSPFELSGGQKRRVAIAGILAMQPEVMILDEPTAGLDPQGRDEILGAISQMHQKLGILVILVSHSMEDVARLADRIVVFHQGKVAYCGTPREVFSHARQLEEIGLAAPAVSYILADLRDRGFDLPGDLYTMDEGAQAIYEALQEKGL